MHFSSKISNFYQYNLFFQNIIYFLVTYRLYHFLIDKLRQLTYHNYIVHQLILTSCPVEAVINIHTLKFNVHVEFPNSLCRLCESLKTIYTYSSSLSGLIKAGNSPNERHPHGVNTHVRVQPCTLIQAVRRGYCMINTTLAFVGCARSKKQPVFHRHN